MSDAPPLLFDPSRRRQQRCRAAATLPAHDFLYREVNDRLVERLQDVKRRFSTVLILGAQAGLMAEQLDAAGIRKSHGITTLITADLCPELLGASSDAALVCAEDSLPLADNSIDLIISSMQLHWVNDLPGALVQMQRALMPDGLLLAALPGGETLTELRQSMAQAESTLRGGISPRVAPFADVRDVGSLLQRAGFNLPIIDCDRLTVSYPHVIKLLEDIRGMGETNLMQARARGLCTPQLLAHTGEVYAEQFGQAQPDGSLRLPATVDIITCAGWKPHSSQPKAAARGSGQHSLAQVFEKNEKNVKKFNNS